MGARQPELPHHGPNLSSISLAGLPGFVFAIGFVWMFWFGVPGFRPIVVGITVLGAITGSTLILLNRRHRVPSDAPLHLEEHQPLGPEDVPKWPQ